MTTLLQACSHCGCISPSPGLMVMPGAQVTIKNCVFSSPCPNCGKMAHANVLEEHTIVGRITEAFSAAGLSTSDLIRFNQIAKATRDGSLTMEEAAAEIGSISQVLQTVWGWMAGNAATLGLLISIVALYISIAGNASSGDASGRQLEESRKQTELTQQIVQALNKPSPVAATDDLSRPEIRKPVRRDLGVPALRHLEPNRHERRKAKALADRS